MEEKLDSALNIIYIDFKIEFINWYDNNSSLISKRNNESFHKEKKEELHRTLINKSKNYNNLNTKIINDLINKYINLFDIIINQ